eukprot:scaffold252510_cov26-Prasinocladus_malaysianus.AAC.2
MTASRSSRCLGPSSTSIRLATPDSEPMSCRETSTARASSSSGCLATTACGPDNKRDVYVSGGRLTAYSMHRCKRWKTRKRRDFQP